MSASSDRYQKLMASRESDAPFCACGCGLKTKWSIRTKSYGRYLFNHQLPNLQHCWTDRIDEIVRGTVLGDGHLDPRKGRSGRETGLARLAIRHSTKRQLEYARWLHTELAPITTSKLRVRATPKAFGKEIAEFSTVSLPQLYDIRLETYRSGIKVVTETYLDKLSDFSVAVWWCDDGSNNSFSTHSFSRDENDMISAWLNDRYDLETWVEIDKRVNLPFIRCNSESMRTFGQRIFKFVEKSLWYKFSRFLPELLKQELSVSSQLELQ